MPFWPGGFEDESVELPNGKGEEESPKGLKTVPPGFERGLRLPGDPVEEEELVAIEEDGTAGDVEPAEVGCSSRRIMLLISHILQTPKSELEDFNENDNLPDQKDVDSLLPTSVSFPLHFLHLFLIL